MMTEQQNFYQANIYRFYLEPLNATVDMVVANSISWDTNKYALTREELKGLADFIYQTIGEK
jgi:hypothetical protein